MTTRRFRLGVGAIALGVGAQSAAHLTAALPLDDVNSVVDLDRSNSIPDIVSAAVIGLAAAGSAVLATRRHGAERIVATALAAAISLVVLEDVLHQGPGDASPKALLVLGSAVLTSSLIAVIGSREGTRVRWSLLAGIGLLVGDLVVGELDDRVSWLVRDRGDRIAELLIVAKQGLELAGWGFIVLAIWDAALPPRAGGPADATPRASRPPEPSTPHDV